MFHRLHRNRRTDPIGALGGNARRASPALFSGTAFPAHIPRTVNPSAPTCPKCNLAFRAPGAIIRVARLVSLSLTHAKASSSSRKRRHDVARGIFYPSVVNQAPAIGRASARRWRVLCAFRCGRQIALVRYRQLPAVGNRRLIRIKPAGSGLYIDWFLTDLSLCSGQVFHSR